MGLPGASHMKGEHMSSMVTIDKMIVTRGKKKLVGRNVQFSHEDLMTMVNSPRATLEEAEGLKIVHVDEGAMYPDGKKLELRGDWQEEA